MRSPRLWLVLAVIFAATFGASLAFVLASAEVGNPLALVPLVVSLLMLAVCVYQRHEAKVREGGDAEPAPIESPPAWQLPDPPTRALNHPLPTRPNDE